MKSRHERIREGFRRYAKFSNALRNAAATAANESGEPDWPSVFRAAREGLDAPGRAPDGNAGPPRSERTARWTNGPAMVARAATVAVLIAGATLFTVQEIKLQTARSFVRQDTTQLVNEIVGSSLYSTLSTAAGTGVLESSSLFEAGDLSGIASVSTER